MKPTAKALHALACLLALLLLILLELHSWWRHSGCPQEQVLRRALVCTWFSFSLVYPIATALVMVHWPAQASFLRNSFLLLSLVLLLALWLVSSFVALVYLCLGPDFD